MLKIIAIVSLMLIGSTLWAESLSCDSCGSECASACGTRHFRSCCFNYLRRKRGPEGMAGTKQFYTPTQDMKKSQFRHGLPMFNVENIPIPEQWLTKILTNENYPYFAGDMAEDRFYEA